MAVTPPKSNGSFNGEVRVGSGGNRNEKGNIFYKWNGTTWVKYGRPIGGVSREYREEYKLVKEQYNEQQTLIKRGENPELNTAAYNNPGDVPNLIKSGVLDDGKVNSKTKKWPNAAIESSTDYVFFQFGKFIPPFSRDANSSSGSTFSKRAGYNASIHRMKPDERFPSIMLPIPQDLGNELQQGWQGKAFTGMGRAALGALAAGNFNTITQKMGDFTGNIKAIQDSLTSLTTNLIPGTGGNLDVNDISGSTRGVVLNPNAELLYDSPELREIGMTWKLVPKNDAEARTIRDIIKAFRTAALPQWGGTEDTYVSDSTIYKNPEDDILANATQRDNFIRVPRICKFTFMKGGEPHEWLTQFKPCAISNVAVSFTPDGTFATYSDGSPVATELRLSFQETKLIFADEVGQGF